MPNNDGDERMALLVPKHFAGDELAVNLPVSAILFQARTLLDAIEVFTESDYPRQTLTIAHIIKLLAHRAHAELFRLDSAEKVTVGNQARTRDLGSIVHVLHSYLRYLQASDPLRTPPGIQQAISLLISAHGPTALRCNTDDISVLVRPQWTYNLKYIDIIPQFDYEVECDLAFALDPDRNLPIYNSSDYDAQDLINGY